MVEDLELQQEVSAKLKRPWLEIQAVLEDLFGREWEECAVFITTSAEKSSRTEAEVISDLVARAEHKTPLGKIVRRKVVNWIGKPWRERSDPWDRFKSRVPSVEQVQKRRTDADTEMWAAPRFEQRDITKEN